ncbi:MULTISPECIES: DNA-3-methyladenine glycosylase 2 family protein [unclassified Cryobacterium]|uniref:DNA-3-methyladenine glycosylase 2 family protein n=1 Tax=unclassified Cryobacterium TaxID=2649013 RepID=UPI001069123F|nr:MULTISPECIES: AlkA N-terminal domain-containing protein [unclassified Cryobacterium]TFD15861.1 DNA-3-methyladenine glycosylase 2 family protein [Cryobacterium sp. TMT4-10]TFD26242.1 DNA-3-methyladenine glycosylase 2 family protein [Cryobacterium sp. TMT2-23]
MSSRDARFDGQFITGVHSTGIYCRPSCPAATPKPANVSFYLTTAAAHEAGLRACKRCLPDAVPGSPEWNIRDDLAARAMRLIADGAVERDGVPGLARLLGYSERHLTRVLVTELGAGPLALARAHRAQTARLLLQGSELSISAVAFAAGFGSVRQFNDTIAAVYERTPAELRRTLQRSTRPARPRSPSPESAQAVPSAATGISLQLPARAPFDGPGLLRFLAVRALAGVERATAQIYSRTLRLPHGPAWVELTLLGTDAAPSVACRAGLASLADLAPLVSRVRRLLDLDADSRAIDLALAADPALAAGVAATPGMRLPGSIDPEETLFRALIGQQVSVAAARTALTRLTAALGDAFPGAAGAPAPGGDQPGTDQPGTDQHGSDQPLRLFPTAARIAAEGRSVLRGPAARIDTIMRVAEELSTGALTLSFGDTRADLESRLTALPGIGPWTAGYVALRVLGSPDILLTSDLALRQGAARLGLPPDARNLARHGEDWAPWRSYAGMHLWRAAGTPAADLPRTPSSGR